MISRCIYVFLALGLSNPLFGQSEQGYKFLIGGGAGVNSSWLGGDISGKMNGLGYNFILSTGYLIMPTLKLNTMIQFIQINNSSRQPLDITMPGYFINYANSSTWIEVPLTLEYSYLKGSQISLFFGLGFSTAFLLESQITITTKTASGTLTSTFDSRSQTTSFNLLPRINSGLNIHLSERQYLVISFYYQFGVKNTYTESSQDSKLNVIGMDFLFNFKLKQVD